MSNHNLNLENNQIPCFLCAMDTRLWAATLVVLVVTFDTPASITYNDYFYG